MKKLVVACGIALLLAAPAVLAKGRNGGPAVSCWQYGVATARVVAGDPFQVRGEDLRAGLAVVVCFSGDHCLHADVDATGSFVQNRTMTQPGGYTLTVSQARNSRMDNWVLRASEAVTIVP